MTVGHYAITRTAIADLVTDMLDGTLPGKLVFLDADDEVVATCFFAQPEAFQAAVDGLAFANSISPELDAPGGEIAYATFRNGDTDDDIIDCSVTATGGGGDIELTSITVIPGQVVLMDEGMFYLAPP